MSGHVPVYLLLDIVNGDLGPERNILPYMLDHIEGCSECAASLQVLVTLRANRDEAAVEILRAAKAANVRRVTFKMVPSVPSAWARLTGWLSGLVRG